MIAVSFGWFMGSDQAVLCRISTLAHDATEDASVPTYHFLIASTTALVSSSEGYKHPLTL